MPLHRGRALPRRPYLIAHLAILSVVQAANTAHAWGRLGHRVISHLAEKQLTPKTKAAMAELHEPGESLADASLSAD